MKITRRSALKAAAATTIFISTRAQAAEFTYKLATGSMFAQMRRHLGDRLPAPLLELKSRSGALSESDRRALDRFVAGS